MWIFLIAGYLVLVWLYMLNNIHWKIKSYKQKPVSIWQDPNNKTKDVVQDSRLWEYENQVMQQRCRVFIVNKISLAIATILIVSSLKVIESQLISISVVCLLLSLITWATFLVVPVKK